jgi:hypothetical protein
MCVARPSMSNPWHLAQVGCCVTSSHVALIWQCCFCASYTLLCVLQCVVNAHHVCQCGWLWVVSWRPAGGLNTHITCFVHVLHQQTSPAGWCIMLLYVALQVV